jgi:hypothetical protein
LIKSKDRNRVASMKKITPQIFTRKTN